MIEVPPANAAVMQNLKPQPDLISTIEYSTDRVVHVLDENLQEIVRAMDELAVVLSGILRELKIQ